MQQSFKQIRILSLALLLTFTAVLFTACNNEGEKTEATTDSVAAPATDSLPAIDTSSSTRPDPGSTGTTTPDGGSTGTTAPPAGN